MNQRSSFVSLAEEIAAMNRNSVEIVTKLNNIVTSQDSSVSISLVDNNGNKTNYYMPTVGYLKKEIDKINSNIKRLAGIESSTNIIDGKSIRKIYTVDINKEPYPINELNKVTTFKTVNNHFFESLMNPLLTINIDLSDKVTSDINKILSRRYIINFERDDNKNLTDNGLIAYNIFIDKFLNKNNININDFIDWYDNQTMGLIKDIVKPYDEQLFDLSVNESNYHGIFSVIKTETDTINKKMWYHLNTLTYYTKEGYDKSLSIGDNLILNKLNSTSRWKIIEINTESSNYRVSLERLEGYDPVPIGVNVLSYYSNIQYKKNVDITIGFDEFCIIFIKPINTDNNVISTIWSKGVCFNTNDLMLDTDKSTRLSDYYVRNVYDYGIILKDLVKKTIPIEYTEKPNKPILSKNNFKVVQINGHLTNSKDIDTLNKLHSNSISVKSKLSELNKAISDKQKEINTISLVSPSDVNILQNELQKLINEQNSETISLSTIISQINSLNSTTSSVNSKFRVRGFWEIPQPTINNMTDPQHIVQFRIQYRYKSKSGEINSTHGFELDKTGGEVGNTLGIVVPPLDYTKDNKKQSLNTGDISMVSINNTDTTNKKTTAYFSNWINILTDVRKRYWDSEKHKWYWKIEDVEDADTPNINQLDIPIQSNEKVEIRIKSISEAGWPDTKIESDWSNVIEIEFPDNLKNILNDNDTILKQANQDEVFVNLDNNLNSRGVYKHVQDSFYVDGSYYAHIDRDVKCSINIDNKTNLNLFDYLMYLTDKIKKLEDIINKTKGDMVIILHTPDNDIIVENNKTYNLIVELEDYAEKYDTTRTYWNSIGIIDNYYLEIKNSSNNPLNLFSNRKYENTYENTFFKFENNKTLIVDYNSDLYTQRDYQWIWFSDNSDGQPINSGASYSQTPFVLKSNNYNLGYYGQTGNTFYGNIITDVEWDGDISLQPELFTTIHPRIYNTMDIVEESTDKLKKIPSNTTENIYFNIYYKLDGNQPENSQYVVPVGTTPNSVIRTIKVFIEPNNLTRPFEFEVRFTLNQFKSVYTI